MQLVKLSPPRQPATKSMYPSIASCSCLSDYERCIPSARFPNCSAKASGYQELSFGKAIKHGKRKGKYGGEKMEGRRWREETEGRY